jgi:hypothetical protein
MPKGIAIMEWNDRSGAEILATYPEEYDIDPKLMMQIFSQHEYSGEGGLIILMSETLNLASYSSGGSDQIFVILFLTEEEDGHSFEDGLADVAREMKIHKDSDDMQEILERQYRRLEIFPRINKEQKLSLVYFNDIRRAIIGRLRAECMLQKSELNIWIKDEFREGEIDIEWIINSVLQNGLCQVGSVKGYSSDLLFLINDLMITRKPPRFYRNPSDYRCPKSLVIDYQTAVRIFFSDYRPNEVDNLKLIDKIILDPANYEVFTLLRLAIVTRSDLEKLQRKGVDDIDAALELFNSLKLITVLRDENNTEYFALLSDFEISQFFPKYILNSVRQSYMVKQNSNLALLTHIDLLAKEFMRIFKLKKKTKKDYAPASYSETDSLLNLDLSYSGNFGEYPSSH